MRFFRIVGPLIVVSLLVLAALALINRSSEQEGSATQPTPTATPTAERTEVLSAEDRSALSDRVDAFSELFFSLDPSKSNEEVEQSVRPYATDTFMETAQFGFGASEADQAMIREGAVLEVKAVSELVGGVLNKTTVTGSVTLLVTKLDSDGNIVTSNERQQEMTWVKTDGVWLIREAPRT